MLEILLGWFHHEMQELEQVDCQVYQRCLAQDASHGTVGHIYAPKQEGILSYIYIHLFSSEDISLVLI